MVAISFNISFFIPDRALLQKEPQDAEPASTLRRERHSLSSCSRGIRAQAGRCQDKRDHVASRGRNFSGESGGGTKEADSGFECSAGEWSVKYY